jgi:tape measure domain-containing protein
MLSLNVRDADVVRRELEKMGAAGEAALKRLDDAARRASERGGAGGGLSPLATAAGEVARSFESMGSRLGPLGAGLSALGVGGAAAAAGIGAIGIAAVAAARAGDELTQTLSRLTAATGNQQAAVAVYDQLYRLSLQTGQSVADTASAFSRFTIATRAVGGTNEQALALVRTLQQAAIVAGASGQEAASAALQLGQALASGVLQGDELRSLLEAMPNLAEALAKQLGVSIGELRKMGSEGQLTADRVMPAILRAGEQIREQFEQMPPSLSRGFSAVSTATARFLGELDRALGTSQSIAERLMGASRIIDGIRLRAGLGTAEENAANTQAVAEDRVRTLRADITRMESSLNAQDADGVRTAMPSGARSQLERQLQERREQLALEEQVVREALEERNRLARQADDVRQAEEVTASGRRIENERRRNSQQTRELEEALDKRARAEREYQETVQRIERARLLGEGAGGVSPSRADELLRAARERRDQASGAAAEAERAARESERITEMVNRVVERDRQEQERNRQREQRDLQTDVDRFIRDTETPLQRYERRIAEIYDLAERARKNGNPIPVENIERAVERVGEETQRTGQFANQLGFSFSSAFEDAILKGESFSNVLKAIEQDIARIIIRTAITQPIGNALAGGVQSVMNNFPSPFAPQFNAGVGNTVPTVSASGGTFAMGGIMTPDGPLPLNRYASGGIADSPQIALFGEGRTPEAYVPLPDGRRIPVAMQGGGGLTFAPTYNIDARGADASMVPRLRAEMVAIARASNAELLDSIQRGGSASRIVGRRA